MGIQNACTRARSDVVVAERTLHRLVQTYSPEALFASAFVYLVVVPADRAPSADRGTVPAKLERLAFHLLPYRDRGGQVVTPEAVDMALQAADVLVSGGLLEHALGEGRERDELDSFMARVLIDAHVVRGSAYPEQTAEEIKEIAGRFDDWFDRTLRASATDLVDCLWAVVLAQERKINAWLDAVQAGWSWPQALDINHSARKRCGMLAVTYAGSGHWP